jgi:uncharacterized membrane protein
MTRIRASLASTGFYPVTLMYVTGVALAFAVVGGVLDFGVALVVFAVVAAVIVVVKMRSEVRAVHKLLHRVGEGVSEEPTQLHSRRDVS